MQAKFAKAIARNIRIIAEETARISLIDQQARIDKFTLNPEARVEACRRIDKAEENIASLLQQPGAKLVG